MKYGKQRGTRTKRRSIGSQQILAGSLGIAVSLAAGLAQGGPGLAQERASLTREPMPVQGQVQTAQVAAPEVDFAIAAQPLLPALIEFGRVANVDLVFDDAILRDQRTSGAVGKMSAEDALRRLVAGTQVMYRYTAARTVTFDRLPDSAGPATLPGVTSEADRVPPTATIGNLMPEYAGGQVARGGRVGFLGNRDFMDTPFNQTNYTAKLIQDQQAVTLSDVLSNSPSVRASRNPANNNESVVIRGFSILETDYGIDGLYGLSGHRRVGLDSVERVEVLKGPAAMINGLPPNGSVGGSVNFIPKYAGDDDVTALTLGYGSDTQYRQHADVGRRFGDNKEFGFRANVAHRNGDTAVDMNSEEFTSATIALDYRGERFRLASVFGYNNIDLRSYQQGIGIAANVPVPKPPDNTTNLQPPWTFDKVERYYGIVRGEVDLSEDWTVSLAYGQHRLHEELLRSTTPTITSRAGTFTSGTATSFSPDERFEQSVDGAIRGRAETGPVGHKFVFGTSAIWQDQSIISTNGISPSITSNIYAPTYGPQPNANLIRRGGPKTAQRDYFALAVSDTLSVLEERVQVTVGARQQVVDVKGFNALSGAQTASYRETALSPAVGVLVKPLHFWSLYGNYIEGLQQGPVAPNTAANAGQVFAPFKAEQMEAGTKFDLGRLAITLSGFQISLPAGLTNPATNIFSVDGESRSRGVELEVFGEVTEGVRLLGGLAYVDTVLSKTANGVNEGNQVPGRPEYFANLGTEWDVPWVPGLTLTGRVIYTGSSYVDSTNIQKVPSWLQGDLGARYAFDIRSTPITVRADVLNVSDSSYWVATGGQLNLGTPRTYLLSTTVNF